MKTSETNFSSGNSLKTSTFRTSLAAGPVGGNLDLPSVSAPHGGKRWTRATSIGALLSIAAGTGAVLALSGTVDRKRLASGGGKLAGIMFPLVLSKALDGLCEVISLRAFTPRGSSSPSRTHPVVQPEPAVDAAAYIQRGEALYAQWSAMAEPRTMLPGMGGAQSS